MTNTNTPHNKGTSKYKGVSYHKHAKQWYARIKFGGQIIRIGTFTDEIACANAYNHIASLVYKDTIELNAVPYMTVEEWSSYRTSREPLENVFKKIERLM